MGGGVWVLLPHAPLGEERWRRGGGTPFVKLGIVLESTASSFSRYASDLY